MEPEFGGADAVNHAEFGGESEVGDAADFEIDSTGFEVFTDEAGFDAATDEVVEAVTDEVVEVDVVTQYGVVAEVDVVVASDELDIDGSVLDAIEQELAEVERALALIDDGTYGQCQACGGSIDDAVLDRAPTSRFCAEHLPLSLR